MYLAKIKNKLLFFGNAEFTVINDIKIEKQMVKLYLRLFEIFT